MSLAGCTAVAPVQSPLEYLSTKPASTVWIVNKDDSVIRVQDPWLHGDTVIGSADGHTATVPLSEIAYMRAPQFSTEKTIELVMGGAVGIAAGVLLYKAIVPPTAANAGCAPDDRHPGYYLC